MVPKHFTTVVLATLNLERAVTCLGLRANERRKWNQQKNGHRLKPRSTLSWSRAFSLGESRLHLAFWIVWFLTALLGFLLFTRKLGDFFLLIRVKKNLEFPQGSVVEEVLCGRLRGKTALWKQSQRSGSPTRACSASRVLWVRLLIALYLYVFIVKIRILIAALPA